MGHGLPTLWLDRNSCSSSSNGYTDNTTSRINVLSHIKDLKNKFK
jgi:hypothetical protein